MPAILREEDHEAWLNGTPDEARAVLKQYPSDLMVAYKVSTRVNSPKNNGPELIEPMREPEQVVEEPEEDPESGRQGRLL
jgi:putative SOS response-associated peptidase YedK